MKVLVVTDIQSGRIGGAEGHFVEVAKRLRSKTKIIVPKVYYPRLPNLAGLSYILFATPVIIAEAFKHKPDLIWATLDFPQAQVGAVVKFFTGIPLYITSQNPLLGEQELVGFGGQIVKYLVAFAFRQADTVAAVSSYSANIAKKLGAKNVAVIPNGVDKKKYV